MKTYIHITGQISGNYVLLGAIGHGEESTRLPFNGFRVEFSSKKEAVKAIREAYNYLKKEEPEAGRIKANKSRTCLYYDASKAEIFN